VALVRVYCGLASAESVRPVDPRLAPAGTWLTLAVVDDSGRLLDVCGIADDPIGYARLGSLLAERSSGPSGIAIAADSDDHLVTMLLTAAGRPLAFADDDTVDDFAERFADDESAEEMQSTPAERRAIGLARALQAGALSAVSLPAPREMAALKPVLAAHSAVAVGRHAAAVALREVLRELYPAALRAYPDPAESVPLAVLDALPEPGLVGGANASRGRDADAVAGQLAASGIADLGTIAEAITALRVAVAETPRRPGVNRSLTAAVAQTVRHAVAAVRACDAAGGALIGALADRANPYTPAPSPHIVRQRLSPAPTSAPPAVLRAVREPTSEHPAIRVPMPRRNRPAQAPVSPAAAAQQAYPAPGYPYPAPAYPTPAYPTPAYPTPPAIPSPVPPPPPGITPIPPPLPTRGAPEPFRTTVTAAAPGAGSYGGAADYVVAMTNSVSAPPAAPPGSRANWPLSPLADLPAEPLPLAPDPILGDPYAADPYAADPYAADPYAATHRPADRPMDLPSRPEGRVTPPWQADDLPPEPPMLRLVEPPPLADPALRPYGNDLGIGSDGVRFDPPALRLVDSPDGSGRSGRAGAGRGRRQGNGTGLGASTPPAPMSSMAAEDDADLLIFAAARSVWFTDPPEDEAAWKTAADAGWRAAEQAARPAVGLETSAGLPKRVPQANLVPGSPISAPDRPLRIVRDPESIAAHTSGYFSGYRRGQEIGGYAVGGRPGRESAHGWDFSRESGEREYDPEYDYRATAYRS
jgi:hypothetical protein